MAERSLPLFRWRGVPVRLHWTAPIGLYIFGGGRWWGALGALILILAHELGHAWMVRRFGLRATGVLLHGFGGECRYEGAATAREDALIAWGGVMAQGLLLAGALLYGALAGPPVGAADAILRDTFVQWNVYLIVLNLLPMEPLDGARAWRAFPLYFSATPSARRRAERRGDVARGHWRDGNPRGTPQRDAKAIADAAIADALKKARAKDD